MQNTPSINYFAQKDRLPIFYNQGMLKSHLLRSVTPDISASQSLNS